MKECLLGKKVKDKVTGLLGIATQKIIYMNGCIQYSIQPKKIVDGVPVDAKWYDEEQVELVNKKKTVKVRPGGGPPPSSVPHRGR